MEQIGTMVGARFEAIKSRLALEPRIAPNLKARDPQGKRGAPVPAPKAMPKGQDVKGSGKASRDKASQAANKTGGKIKERKNP